MQSASFLPNRSVALHLIFQPKYNVGKCYFEKVLFKINSWIKNCFPLPSDRREVGQAGLDPREDLRQRRRRCLRYRGHALSRLLRERGPRNLQRRPPQRQRHHEVDDGRAEAGDEISRNK